MAIGGTQAKMMRVAGSQPLRPRPEVLRIAMTPSVRAIQATNPIRKVGAHAPERNAHSFMAEVDVKQ
jgi:hypothetical protein